MELYLVYNAARKQLEKHGLKAARSLVGNYVTSLDMAGCSLTVSLLDAETDAPLGCAGAHAGAPMGYVKRQHSSAPLRRSSSRAGAGMAKNAEGRPLAGGGAFRRRGRPPRQATRSSTSSARPMGRRPRLRTEARRTPKPMRREDSPRSTKNSRASLIEAAATRSPFDNDADAPSKSRKNSTSART